MSPKLVQKYVTIKSYFTKLALVQSHGTMGTLVSNLSPANTKIFSQTQYIFQFTSTNTVKKLISTFLAKCTK